MLKYSAFALLVPAVCLLAWSGWGTQAQITQEELVRNTQEIFDAVAPGNAEPFKKYFAECSSMKRAAAWIRPRW